MKTLGIDTEYDYCSPFLATTTDEDLVSKVYRPKILSHLRELKKICESRNIRKVFHHASGDMFILKNVGIHVQPPYDCTLIQANLVNENYSSRNLKKLAEFHLGETIEESNLLKGIIKKYKAKALKEGRRFKWSEIPDEYIIPYAKRDPEYTIKLHYYWQTPVAECSQLYEFEKSLIPTLVQMEWEGLRIDRFLCARKSREYGYRKEELHEEMAKYIIDNHIHIELKKGKSFNPRSTKQIQQLIVQLVQEKEIDESVVTRAEKTDMPVTDKKALAKLGAMGGGFFKILQKYRFFNKHKGTYYDPLIDYYTNEKSDIAHFMTYQTGAKTGRFSVELAQTFPRPEESKVAGETHEVRNAIIPKRGKCFLSKDYEQQEMKLFFHYSDCQVMIDLINGMGGRIKDVYIPSGELLFGDIFHNKLFHKALRYVTKRCALSGIYGVGMDKLISTTTIELLEKFDREVVDTLGVNEQWAYDVLQKFYEIYPVREYTTRKIDELYKKGYIDLEFNSELMQFKRRYQIPQEKAYKGPNAEIQGTAAYVIKHAMKRIEKRIEKEHWQGRVAMLLQLHDEILFEIDNDYQFVLEVNKALTEEMEDWVTFKVPITCSAKWSNISWGQVKELT